MPRAVLETSGLTVRFGGVTAVDNVDFKLQERELHCLIGPNGAGKSTFFKCISGLIPPTLGEIHLRNEETTGWHPHQIAALGVGVKTQVPSVIDGMDVRDNIWLAAQASHGGRHAKQLAATIVDRLGLGAVIGHLVGQLSHGQRQLVELGIVMAGEPWLVLLDEPAAGMTGEEIELLGEIIRDLNSQASIIIVEHDMQFIRSIAQQVTVFANGSVLINDEVEAVMADPRVREIYLGNRA